ncbi:MAG TPA: TonB-dependent receptor, partial [Niabella sp.]|nr:TonB-dependent receptor [Niabella sp.]
MQKLFMLLACSYCFALGVTGQGVLKGKLTDSTTNEVLGLATVTVYKAMDTSILTYRLSSTDGYFKVPGLPLHVTCRVIITMSGYGAYRKEFMLGDSTTTLDLGTLKLSHSNIALEEVVVIAERPPVIFKKDTVEFNANAFKTLPNALVEDLLKKLPGVQVDADGNIMVNGKPVNKITVDGKSFFGDDPKMATRNLPANVIDKVQVTDDKEELLRSGDDNLNNVGKVVNLTLKKGVKKGWFGKLYAGSGTSKRYEAGGIANIYRDTLQVSLLGYTNNLNRPGFSWNELMQTGGFQRSRGITNNSGMSQMRNANGSNISVNGISFGGMQSGGGVETSSGYGFNLDHTPN